MAKRTRKLKAKPTDDETVSLPSGHIIGPDGRVRRSPEMQKRVQRSAYIEAGVSVGYTDTDLAALRKICGFARTHRVPPQSEKPVAFACIASKVSELSHAITAYAIRATMDDFGTARSFTLSSVVDDSFDAIRRRATAFDMDDLDTVVLQCENPLNSRAYPPVLTEVVSIRMSRSGTTVYIFDCKPTIGMYGAGVMEFLEQHAIWLNGGDE